MFILQVLDARSFVIQGFLKEQLGSLGIEKSFASLDMFH